MRFVVLVVLFLTGCATGSQKLVDISDVDTSDPAYVGYYVTYTEVCGFFYGNGADNLKIRSLIEFYKGNERFQKGYVLNRNVFGAGGVSGFDECDVAKAVVDFAYVRGTERAKKLNPRSDTAKIYFMSLTWKGFLESTTTFPVEIKETEQIVNVSSNVLVGGRTCATVLTHENLQSGKWSVRCGGDKRANGSFQMKNGDYVSHVEGKDAEGNLVKILLSPTPGTSNLSSKSTLFSKFAPEFTHYTTFKWQKRLREEMEIPVKVRKIGKLTTFETKSLFSNNPCSVAMKIGRANEDNGTWYLHCQNGPYAEGTLKKLNYGVNAAATGSDTEGNKVSFTIGPNKS